MKNISLILNGILIIAVGVLYYLHFSSASSAGGTSAGSSMTSLSDQKIVYVNTDSLFKSYQYVDEIKKQLETKETKLNQEFRNRAQGLQNEFNDYQRNAGSLTLSQARSIEENLTKKEQNLRMYEQSLAQELSNEQIKIQTELYKRVTEYLKEYGKGKGLQIVMKFDPTSDVLFASDSLDITKEVIEGLNTQYKDEKSGVKAKADSTSAKNK